MLFSVIIPVYNCKVFLADTVEQVQNAGLWDYEILLIDDGSTDGTSRICDALAEAYGEVRCIHQFNAGVSAARNRGIQEAQGDYILFFDADDGVDAGALRNAAQTVQREKPDMLIFGMSFDYYFHGRRYRRDELIYPEPAVMNRQQWSSVFGELYRCNALSPVWNKLIRRDLLTHYSIAFSGQLIEMEDFVFSVDCMKYCGRVILLPEAVYRYRQTEDERSTYRRLCRIDSLSAYMESFTECMEAVIAKTGAEGEIGQEMRRVVDTIYLTFLRERIRYARPKAIRQVGQDMLAGSFAQAVEREAPELFRSLKDGKYSSIWLRNRISRSRHWLAVRVKYLRSLGRR